MTKLTTAIVANVSAEAVKSALVDVFGCFDDRTQTILAEKVLGVFEAPEIPNTSNVNKDATFARYNVLEDRVYYTYTDVETRYFKTYDEANAWTNGGSSYYSSYRKDDEFTIEVTRESRRDADCNLRCWLSKQS